MQNILQASFFVRALRAFFIWVGAKWHHSRIISWFLSPKYRPEAIKNSIFSRFWRRLHSAVFTVSEKLRLTRLLQGSLFRQSFLWCLLPALLAPVLPTMIVLCLVLVAVFASFIRFATTREDKPLFYPVNKYIILFAAVYLLATFTSVTVSGSLFTGLLTIAFTLFAVFLSRSVTSQRQIDLAIRLLALAGTLVSLYGVYQYFNYSPENAGMWLDQDMFSEVTNRVYSTLDNPNVLAEYLLLITPFCFACVLTSKTWPKRILFLGCTGIMLICMLLTSSRGGWLGLIFAAAIFVAMLDARFILIGLVGLVLIYFALPDWAVQRFASIGNMSDSSTSYRVYIWYGTLSMLKDYWFSGIGPGTAAFNLVYPAYGFNTISAPHAHNLLLQLTCDAGILGLILFLVIIFSYFRMTFSAFSKDRNKATRVYLIAAISSVGGFLVQSMTDYSFYNSRVMLLFWVVIAVGAVLVRRSSLEEGTIWSES